MSEVADIADDGVLDQARAYALYIAGKLWGDDSEPARLRRAAHEPKPEPARPTLRAYRRRVGVTQIDAAAALGVHVLTLQRYERPFEDRRRQIPGLQIMRRIHAWSGGQLTPADFYPADLRREPGSSEIGR